MDKKEKRAQYMRNYRARKKDELNGLIVVPVQTKQAAKSNNERNRLYRQRLKNRRLEAKQKLVPAPRSNKALINELTELCRQRKLECEALQNDNGASTSRVTQPTDNSEVRENFVDLSLEMIKEEPHSDLEDDYERTLFNVSNIKKEDGNMQDICFVSVKSENELSVDMLEEELDSYPVSPLGVSDIKKEDSYVQDNFTGVKIEEQANVDTVKVEPDLDGYASSSPAFCDVEKEECTIQDVKMETIKEESHELISNSSNDETDKNVFMEKTDLNRQNDSAYLFICDVCKKPFSSKRNFDRHQFFHTNEPFVCDICNRSFMRKRHLKRHQYDKSHFVGEVRRRREGGKFVCICKKTFAEKRYLKSHQTNKRHYDTQSVPTASDQ